eukprot:1925701-Rhodomonas_salina.1
MAPSHPQVSACSLSMPASPTNWQCCLHKWQRRGHKTARNASQNGGWPVVLSLLYKPPGGRTS